MEQVSCQKRQLATASMGIFPNQTVSTRFTDPAMNQNSEIGKGIRFPRPDFRMTARIRATEDHLKLRNNRIRPWKLRLVA
jgi:hypothetical protein